jgi:hypothetical protein
MDRMTEEARMGAEATLVWPMVAVLGFVAFTGVVVALAMSSTARFEFERNRVPMSRAVAAHPAGRATASRRTEGGAEHVPSERRSADGERQAQPGGVAIRDVGPSAGGSSSGSGWWLVEEAAVGSPLHPVAGPFRDRLDADWAALGCGLLAFTVHGDVGADGVLAPRTAPSERAWLTELGDQLDRLPDEWDDLLTESDPLTTLVVEVAAALVEAGLPLDGGGQHVPAGGVCLTPDPASCGVLVSWRAHDRLAVHHERGVDADAAVQRVMNAAVAEVLTQLAFVVAPLGSGSGHRVSAIRR